MSLPRIVAVATATPPHRFSQAELLALAGYEDPRRRGFFEKSGIEGRYLYLDPATFRPDETVDEMQDRFQRGALEIAEDAARRALAGARWTAKDVDFIATTTCTGRQGPCPTMVGHRTLFRSEHLPVMGFEYPGGRPRVILSKEVRRIGAVMMHEMAEILMAEQGLKREDVRYWVLHSAGRRVLDRPGEPLELTPGATAPARTILRSYGHMSSA